MHLRKLVHGVAKSDPRKYPVGACYSKLSIGVLVIAFLEKERIVQDQLRLSLKGLKAILERSLCIGRQKLEHKLAEQFQVNHGPFTLERLLSDFKRNIPKQAFAHIELGSKLLLHKLVDCPLANQIEVRHLLGLTASMIARTGLEPMLQ